MNPTDPLHIIMSLVDIMDSNPELLASTDLNLLVAFDALLRELSVTRAAERMRVSQSAMSHTLRRLRELFDDPLLVRARGGMVPTSRAESLVGPVRSALIAAAHALSRPTPFEPATTHRAFRLATPDLYNILTIPSLLAHLRDHAPHIDLTLFPLRDVRVGAQLETGDVDAAVVPWMEGDAEPHARSRSHPGLVRKRLFSDHFTTFIRAEHPALDCAPDAWTPASFAALSHALVSVTGEGLGIVDAALKPLRLHRRIALRVPDFTSALAIIARSDLVLTAPASLARTITPEMRVVTRTPPLELPGHSLNLLWHERFTSDPAHTWLRDALYSMSRPKSQPEMSNNRPSSAANTGR